MEKWTAKLWFYHAVAMKELSKKYQGSYKKLWPFFKDFTRVALDFQGPPTTV